MFAKESIDLVFREENIFKSTQRLQTSMFRLSNLIHRSAELSSQLENENIAYNTELWNGDHYVLLLSGYSIHLML